MSLSDPLSVVRILTDVFEKLSIKYLIGGSLASSLHGIPRATQDVDVVADIRVTQVSTLIENLKASFFVDEEMIRKAVMNRETFNIIDKENLFKIDVFMYGADEFSEKEMERRVLFQLPDSTGQKIYLCSPEDIIAHKLYWYKLGNFISERQWNDAANVIKVQSEKLDIKYLKEICTFRGVFDLFEKIIKECK
jgi:hypothetical protein